MQTIAVAAAAAGATAAAMLGFCAQSRKKEDYDQLFDSGTRYDILKLLSVSTNNTVLLVSNKVTKTVYIMEKIKSDSKVFEQLKKLNHRNMASVLDVSQV
jgi:hypothetical protein